MARRRVARTRRRRRRTGSSSGDRKPQFVWGTITAASSVNWQSTLVQIPLLNILTGGTKVLEILKVTVARLSGSNLNNFALGAKNYQGFSNTTYTPTIAAQDKGFFTCFVLGGTENVREFDLTDDAGNGMLYPAQVVYVNNSCSTSGDTFQIKFLYRIKNATLPEYVGVINQYTITST